MTPETKTKAEAPKNCLKAVSRQDTASRLNITDVVMFFFPNNNDFVFALFLFRLASKFVPALSRN